MRAQRGLSALASRPQAPTQQPPASSTTSPIIGKYTATQISPPQNPHTSFFPHSSLVFGALPRHLSGGEPLNTRNNHKASATSWRRNTPSPNILGGRGSSQDVSKTGKGKTRPTRPTHFVSPAEPCCVRHRDLSNLRWRRSQLQAGTARTTSRAPWEG